MADFLIAVKYSVGNSFTYMTKKEAQRSHAKRRALERYGLQLNRFDIKTIIKMIQTQNAFFIESQSHRLKKYQITYKSTTAIVIYDKLRKEIVTFLPKENNELAEIQKNEVRE